MTDELCTRQIFTAEFLDGISMEQCMQLDQTNRNHVAEKLLQLCLTELFEFRFMQTDPNWANFMYNPDSRQVFFWQNVRFMFFFNLNSVFWY